MNNAECAILVSSFDAYSDLWEPFFTLFFKYWPDCPYPIYLITNNKTYPDKRVTSLRGGDEKGWSICIKKALEKIPSKYVLFMLEDYWMKTRVDTKRIEYLVDLLKRQNGAYLRLYPTPGPDTVLEGEDRVGLISKDAPYRTSLTAALWDKDVFLSLLDEKENAWQMELLGTERSRGCRQPFLSVTRSKYLDRIVDPAIDIYFTAVKRGKWQRGALVLATREGLHVEVSKRKIESRKITIWRWLREVPVLGKIIYALLDLKHFLRLFISRGNR